MSNLQHPNKKTAYQMHMYIFSIIILFTDVTHISRICFQMFSMRIFSISVELNTPPFQLFSKSNFI